MGLAPSISRRWQTGSTQNYNFFYALGFGNVSASGIAVRDIQSPDEAYEKIKTIVDKAGA